MAFIEFNRISKEYQMGENAIKALDAADFIVEKGELAMKEFLIVLSAISSP